MGGGLIAGAIWRVDLGGEIGKGDLAGKSFLWVWDFKVDSGK